MAQVTKSVAIECNPLLIINLMDGGCLTITSNKADLNDLKRRIIECKGIIFNAVYADSVIYISCHVKRKKLRKLLKTLSERYNLSIS